MQLRKFKFLFFSILFSHSVLSMDFEGDTLNIHKNDNIKKNISKLVNEKYEEVYPQDDYKIINISKRDINRIFCPMGIRYYQTSSEKYLAISFAEAKEGLMKKNMFLKIKPKILTSESGVEEKIIYDDTPKELYLMCGNTLYTFILKPLDIPARTIYIKDVDSLKYENVNHFNESVKRINNNLDKRMIVNDLAKNFILEKKGDFKKAISFEKELGSYERTLLALVKYVLKKDDIPGYYKYKHLKLVDSFKQGNLVLNKIYEGPVYRVYLYTFVASVNIDKPLREVDFAYLSKKPLAISLSDLTLKRGESSNIVIVESAKNPVIVFSYIKKEN